MKKLIACFLSISLLFSGCGMPRLSEADTSGNPESQKQPESRVIPAEPESNVENHLVKYETLKLYLQSAVYDEDFSAEYYVSAELGAEGEFLYDSPFWTTLLVRTNGKIYPLYSLAPNRFAASLICAKNIDNKSYTLWVVNTYTYDTISFFKYAYDPELDAYIETQICDDEDGYHFQVLHADLNHSLEEVYHGEIDFSK